MPRQLDTPATQGPKRPALHYAGYLLGLREWSAKELETRLRQRGYPLAEISACLAFLTEKGLQNDERYAAVRARSRSRTLGNRRLKQELGAKGISAETTSQALAGLDDEATRAESAAARFQGQPLTLELRAKVWRFLTARGFSGSSIKHALLTLGESAPPSDADN